MTPNVRTANDALAWLAEREQLRTLRLQRHVAVAAAAAVALAIFASAVDTVVEAAVLPVLVGVVVSSLARGVDAKFGHLWGWLYSEPLVYNALDHLTAKVIERARPPAPRPQDCPVVRVRPIDPLD